MEMKIHCIKIFNLAKAVLREIYNFLKRDFIYI